MRVVCAVMVLCACSEPPATDVQTDSVILGTNDLVRVSYDGTNVPMKYRGMLDAVGRIIPSKCTVTHVGNGIAISAGHCFRGPQARADDLPCTGLGGTTATIQWGVRGELHAEPYLESSCHILALAYDPDGADYAILSVDPAPPRVARVTFERPVAGQALTIFSHPQGRPLEWSQVCPRGDARSPEVFKHSCDTERGSSGAPVLDDAGVAIAGIHNGGYANDFNYATYVADTPLHEFVDGAPPPPPPPVDPSDPSEPTEPTFGPDASYAFFSHTVVANEWMVLGPYDITSALRISVAGTGDVDLYLRRGAKPTPTAYECRPYRDDSNERCVAYGPAQVWMAIAGYAPSSDISVEVAYE